MAIPPFYIHAPRCLRAPQLGGRFKGFHRSFRHRIEYATSLPTVCQPTLLLKSSCWRHMIAWVKEFWKWFTLDPSNGHSTVLHPCAQTSPSDSQIVLQAPSAIESNTQLAYQQFASLPFKANDFSRKNCI
ncbi:hypothetical protein PGTUg99_015345 [Puccinia graminis f. sp. tritici]|uniref:Uncharacterized protein n=1 Tax=Puccinia graminis f. sp. tritici TaxID=56615 RepID=A0A5B0REB8_PUCGR|nr:hypothetical protein PGTUg99_015345 [Puccinia graminis f. sp. tritici]